MIFYWLGSVIYSYYLILFFFNDTATTEIYTLSLHDALPIWPAHPWPARSPRSPRARRKHPPDRKSTRLNSSHGYISYAVFCLKKKNIHIVLVGKEPITMILLPQPV